MYWITLTLLKVRLARWTYDVTAYWLDFCMLEDFVFPVSRSSLLMFDVVE